MGSSPTASTIPRWPNREGRRLKQRLSWLSGPRRSRRRYAWMGDMHYNESPVGTPVFVEMRQSCAQRICLIINSGSVVNNGRHCTRTGLFGGITRRKHPNKDTPANKHYVRISCRASPRETLQEGAALEMRVRIPPESQWPRLQPRNTKAVNDRVTRRLCH